MEEYPRAVPQMYPIYLTCELLDLATKYINKTHILLFFVFFFSTEIAYTPSPLSPFFHSKSNTAGRNSRQVVVGKCKS